MLLKRLVFLLLCLTLPAAPLLFTLRAPAPPSRTALNGFLASAFNSEYGDTARDALIRWQVPIAIWVQGDPTAEDLDTLDIFLKNLRENVPGLPDVSLAQAQAEANVYYSFVPLADMASYLNEYEAGNWGFMNCFSDDTGIRYGLIAVATDVTGQIDRNHLIQEEFVNMLGLTDDIDFAPESIIYQPYTVVQSPAPVDYEMLNLLYGPHVRVNMTMEQAQAVLRKAYPGALR